MKRILIILTGLFPAVMALSAPPNIVVFLVDDMGIMDTSVPFITDKNGKAERHPLNEFYRTPAMERLAAQGMRFNTFYAMSVCSPTRVSIMTGQTSARHTTTQFIKPETNNRGGNGPSKWGWKGLAKGDVTLPGELRKVGYRTIHAGKAHFGPNGSEGENPENVGFDINIAGCAYGQPGSYYGKDDFGWANKKRIKRAVPGLEKYHGKHIYLTEALTLEMNAAIREAVADGKPFFAYMSHYAVHSPFQPDQRFAENYKGKKGAAFASMIEGMDKSLGDILDQLDSLGIAENTLVMFLGDNGTDARLGPTHAIASAAPLRAMKGSHYEGGMRVPFITSWAKRDAKNSHQQSLPIPAGRIVEDLGTVYDLFPTLLSVAGASSPVDHVVDGIDLSGILRGDRGVVKEPREFLMHFPHSHRSSYYTVLRKGSWKLIYHYKKTDDKRFELFNLANDQSESNDLSASQPERLREMMKALINSLEHHQAQYPEDGNGKPIKPVL